MVPRPVATEPVPAPATALGPASSALELMVQAPLAASPAPPPPQVPPVAAQTEPAAQQLAAAAPELGVPAGNEPDAQFLNYLPRSQLTRAPVPAGPVEVPFPAGIKGKVELSVQFSLFIDETGVVRQVRIDSPDVPAPFADAVRSTFGRTRFLPGQIQELAVRSLIRLEVSFNTVVPAR